MLSQGLQYFWAAVVTGGASLMAQIQAVAHEAAHPSTTRGPGEPQPSTSPTAPRTRGTRRPAVGVGVDLGVG